LSTRHSKCRYRFVEGCDRADVCAEAAVAKTLDHLKLLGTIDKVDGEAVSAAGFDGSDNGDQR